MHGPNLITQVLKGKKKLSRLSQRDEQKKKEQRFARLNLPLPALKIEELGPWDKECGVL